MADEIENELAPNSSEAQGIYAPEMVEEERAEEGEEQALITSSFPIFEDILEWFDIAIEGADSVRQAKKTAETNKVELENALIAHELVASLLQSKRDELEARFQTFKRKDNDDE